MVSTIDPTSTTTRRIVQPQPTTTTTTGHDRLLRNGSTGADVGRVQQALKARNPNLAIDNRFGPDTERSVRAFQRSQGITVDGIVGPETRSKLFGTTPATRDVQREGDARAPTIGDRQTVDGTVRAGDLARNDETRRRGAIALAPANMTPEQKFDHYSDIVRRNGGTVNANGQATVLGIRGMSRDGTVHNTGSTRAYDDTFVVLKNGQAFEYSGATHAGQNTSSLVDSVGMIRPGNYRAAPNGPHNGAPSYHVTNNGNNRVAGYRDTNGDGRFSDAERRASEQRGDTMGEILFHQGFSDRPKSIGCLTLSPTQYADFMRRVGGSGASYNFSLVDAYR